MKELISEIETVSGKSLPVEYTSRRQGDSPALVADNRKAKSVLGWQPHYDLNAIIQTAWIWHSMNSLSEHPPPTKD